MRLASSVQVSPDSPRCQCGCGGIVGKQSGRGPTRFVSGHNSRVSPVNWKGGRSMTAQGYVEVAKRLSPSGKGRDLEHRAVAERVLGKPLPPGSSIHHVNEDKTDNRPCNLVICENEAYHQLLHARMSAKAACGHAHWWKCQFCKQWDEPENLRRYPKHTAYHLVCAATHARERLRRIKAAAKAEPSCSNCGAILRAGTCEFCEGVCDTCAAPTERDGTCVNPDCESRSTVAR